MITVVVTGSECTGKTTLAEALARRYGVPLVPEYVREHVEKTGLAPTADDVDSIARAQLLRRDAIVRKARDLLILDTDLLSTYLYSRHYFGACPDWIDEVVNEQAASLYLLTFIDVPWVADGAQRDRGHMRSEMHALFRDELLARRFRFVEIRGSHEQRMRSAESLIDQLLKAPT